MDHQGTAFLASHHDLRFVDGPGQSDLWSRQNGGNELPI